jgi:hypothetical protein
VDYCEASDLYAYGLTRGAIPNPGRLIASVSTSADTLSLDVHGFAADDPVTFRAEAGGSLPGPLVAGTTYYVIPVTESTFQVSATEGGDAIDLTSAGENILVITPLPIAAAISFASRLVDDCLPAHVVPLEEPIADIVKMTTAELAIWKLTAGKGSAKTISEMVDAARKRLERWGKGVPIRGTNAPTPANLAASASVPYLDSRGWNRFGGT